MKINVSQSITDRSSKSINLFFKEMNRFPLLTEVQEQALYGDILAGGKLAEAARDRLVEHNLRICITLAKPYANQGVPFEDLVAEAYNGLIEAAKRFEPTHDAKFVTFAAYYIRQYVRDGFYATARTVRMPENQWQSMSFYKKAIEAFEQVNLRKPSAVELSEYLDEPVERVRRVLRSDVKSSSLDEPLSFTDDITLGETITFSENQTDEYMHKSSTALALKNAMDKQLNDRESVVIKSLYGIGCFACSVGELAMRFNVSNERIRQIRNSALRKLQTPAVKRELTQCLCA